MPSDDVLIIETPEQTPLEYELAGVGSRFIAILIDTLYQFVLAVLLLLIFLFIAAVVGGGDRGAAPGEIPRAVWAFAMLTLAMFVLQFGYFTLFEALTAGQTPGKRRMGLRVIHASGRPMVAHEAVARNLLRIIDGMPAVYGVGLIAIMMSARRQRLGDLLAGTVVVHERTYDSAPFGWALASGAAPVPGGGRQDVLTAEELRVVEAFLQRRDELDPLVRFNLSRDILAKLGDRLGVTAADRDKPETALEDLARRSRERGGRR